MAMSVLTGQLRTGRRLTQLPVTTATWDVKLGEAGSISASIKLDDVKVARRPELLLALEPARSFMAVLVDDTVLEAGPIWSHSYSDTTKILQVRAGGLRSVFDHRLVMKILADGEDPATTSLSYTGALADIARDLVRLVVSHTGGELPIVIGADTGGDHVREYKGHELATAGDRLSQLTGVIGGPDVAFEPRLTSDRLGVEWVMRTGTEADPLLHQPGSSETTGEADHVWDVRAPRSGVVSLDVTRDAGGLAYRMWGSGQGAGEALLIDVEQDSELIDHGYPLLEAVAAHQDVTDPNTLASHTTADLISKIRPWTTWTLSVRGDKRPRLGSYRPGDWARVWVPADHLYLSRYLAAGFYRTRITGISGDLSPAVKIDTAPTMNAR